MSKTTRPDTITEEKTRLDGSRTAWTCDLLALTPGRRAVVRYVLEGDRALGGTDLVLRAGTVTLAHYWADRPYNVYHWLKEGRTVAYYCSVAETTELSAERIAYLDLAVDVLVHPSGALEILDEDELPADLDPRHRRTVADALERIMTAPRALIAEIERESAPFR